MQLAQAMIGTYVEFGADPLAPKTPIIWRVMAKAHRGVVKLIAHEALLEAAFDTQSPEHPQAGDNLWRTSTLRHWLNSEAAAGEVDFGPHPPPDPAQINTAGWGDHEGPDEKNAYHTRTGFLHGFSSHERSLLATVAVPCQIEPSYDAPKRVSAKEVINDRVFIPSWEEHGRLPKDMREPKFSAAACENGASNFRHGASYWSRSPAPGYGISVVNFAQKNRMNANSGSFCAWGIRPIIAVIADTQVVGNGTAESPYRVAA